MLFGWLSALVSVILECSTGFGVRESMQKSIILTIVTFLLLLSTLLPVYPHISTGLIVKQPHD
jgi:type IV secretory pathway TrbL component